MSSCDSAGIKLATLSSSAGSFTCLFDRHSGEVSQPQKVALRKISNNFQQNMLEPIGLAEGYSLRVMQWLVLCGIPYSGSGAKASPDRTNQLPTSLIGQATWPPGGSTAHLQLSKS